MTRTTPARHPFRALVRAASWHRRKLAVVAAVAAVLTGITAASPPDPPTVRVVRAVAQLDGGAVLDSGDVRLVALPRDAVPERALTAIDAAVGQSLTGPIAAGQVLTDLDTGSGRRSVRAGRLLAPLRLADADVAAVLAVGDLIDVIAADAQAGRASVIASSIRVVRVPPAPDDSAMVSADRSSGALLLVEVDVKTATLLAQAAVSSQLSVVVR
jgi:pilus assembly protein CpaB